MEKSKRNSSYTSKSKDKPIFQFPPVSASMEFLPEKKEEIKETLDHEIPVKLIRKNSHKGKNNSHSTNFPQTNIKENSKDLPIMNTSQSVREIKIVEENVYDEFEEDDNRLTHQLEMEKNKSKFIFANMELERLDSNLEIEIYSSINTYEQAQQVIFCHVFFCSKLYYIKLLNFDRLLM